MRAAVQLHHVRLPCNTGALRLESAQQANQRNLFAFSVGHVTCVDPGGFVLTGLAEALSLLTLRQPLSASLSNIPQDSPPAESPFGKWNAAEFKDPHVIVIRTSEQQARLVPSPATTFLYQQHRGDLT